MTAFTVVRFQAKPDHAEKFQNTFCSLKREMRGLRRVVLIKTSDRGFCSIGEWESLQSIVDARPTMRANLDQMRHLLDSFSDELGVTDAVSGEAVLDMTSTC